MTTDFYRINQVVTPIEAVMPNVLSVLERSTRPQARGILPVNWSVYSFSSPSTRWTRSKLNSHKVNKSIYLLCCFVSCALYQNLIRRDLDHLYLPNNFTLDYYTDDIMFIRASEQKAASTLRAVVSMCALKD